jgi:hypothetical protein
MSSATLTERRAAGDAHGAGSADAAPQSSAQDTVRPSQFFALATAALALATGILLRDRPPAELVLAVLTVAAAGLGAFALFRTLAPLTALTGTDAPSLVGGRTRAALERDKNLTLRTIKELEFDHAMGKVSNADFVEMRDRLRARALRLMQQLEGGAGYRERIEQDLAAYVGRVPRSGPGEPDSAYVGRVPRSGPGTAQSAGKTRSGPGDHALACRDCNTLNEADARFCKMCGHALQA